MKFLVDMGISPRAVAFLQDSGHDGMHLLDAKLQRASDKVVLEKARSEGRVLLTHDLDFGELMAASQARLPSVVIFRLRDMRSHNVNKHLHQVILRHHDSLERGAVVIVTEARLRVRALPI